MFIDIFLHLHCCSMYRHCICQWRSIKKLIDRLIDWLIDWLTDWLPTLSEVDKHLSLTLYAKFYGNLLTTFKVSQKTFGLLILKTRCVYFSHVSLTTVLLIQWCPMRAVIQTSWTGSDDLRGWAPLQLVLVQYYLVCQKNRTPYSCP